MKVLINGHGYSLDQSSVIGAGGEGTVFRATIGGQQLAVKVYQKPNADHTKKLQAFLAKSWNLPVAKIALPLHLVYDSPGKKIIGLTMPFFTGFEELTSLANKRYRAQNKIDTKIVTSVFLDGGKTVELIHQNGLIIGDFNDLNALFGGIQMLFIDVDSWQFDQFGCPVATEQFLVPELYGIDLSQRPVFKPEHDWYSYAVLLFKSLLLAHPYGGTHKDLKTITARAANRISAFHKDVTYPKIALPPEVLDDDLTHEFEQIFSKGQRGQFPLSILQTYAQSLTVCQNCSTWYPAPRRQCPVCQAKTLVTIMKPTTVTKGVTVEEFFKTTGQIVFSRLVGNTVYAIVNEHGQAVLYKKAKNSAIVRKELFAENPGAKYELFDDTLAVNLKGSSEIYLLDISGSQPQAITKTETETFSINRRPIFRASQQYLFRIIGGNLMCGEIKNGQLIERVLRSVMNQHTWFTVQHEVSGEKPTACGFFQIMEKQLFWLVWQGSVYDNLAISEMEDGESLIDLTIKFSSQGVLIRRLTQQHGVNYVRTDIVDHRGQIVHSAARMKQEDLVAQTLHGQAYSTGVLLHATDSGVVQENILTGTSKTFEATKEYVAEGNVLYPYEGGLLVVKDNSVNHLSLT